jgi:hypothetical protein
MKHRMIGVMLAVGIAAAPWATAGAQRVTPRDTDSLAAERAAARREAGSQVPREQISSVEYRKAWLRIDSLVAASAQSAPNAGGGIGFTHGAITPGVGMTGGNSGGNNSNGRTATPAQGSSSSPTP